MTSSWSIVLLPWNKGEQRANSAITHPTLHKSIAGSQVEIPSRASGGRYHLEATY